MRERRPQTDAKPLPNKKTDVTSDLQNLPKVKKNDPSPKKISKEDKISQEEMRMALETFIYSFPKWFVLGVVPVLVLFVMLLFSISPQISISQQINEVKNYFSYQYELNVNKRAPECSFHGFRFFLWSEGSDKNGLCNCDLARCRPIASVTQLKDASGVKIRKDRLSTTVRQLEEWCQSSGFGTSPSPGGSAGPLHPLDEKNGLLYIRAPTCVQYGRVYYPMPDRQPSNSLYSGNHEEEEEGEVDAATTKSSKKGTRRGNHGGRQMPLLNLTDEVLRWAIVNHPITPVPALGLFFEFAKSNWKTLNERDFYDILSFSGITNVALLLSALTMEKAQNNSNAANPRDALLYALQHYSRQSVLLSPHVEDEYIGKTDAIMDNSQTLFARMLLNTLSGVRLASDKHINSEAHNPDRNVVKGDSINEEYFDLPAFFYTTPVSRARPGQAEHRGESPMYCFCEAFLTPGVVVADKKSETNDVEIQETASTYREILAIINKHFREAPLWFELDKTQSSSSTKVQRGKEYRVLTEEYRASRPYHLPLKYWNLQTDRKSYSPRLLWITSKNYTVSKLNTFVTAAKTLGFEVIQMEEEELYKLPIHELFHLARYADVILGVRGSMLALSTWMDYYGLKENAKGCRTLVELMPYLNLEDFTGEGTTHHSTTNSAPYLEATLYHQELVEQLGGRYERVLPLDVYFDNEQILSQLDSKGISESEAKLTLKSSGSWERRSLGWDIQTIRYNEDQMMTLLKDIYSNLLTCHS